MDNYSPEKYRLPNNQLIYHLNDYETEYLFHEIFIDETYMNHNININENSVIFDVGANIGLFSLYLQQKFPNIHIYAFEPSKEIFNILRLNTQNPTNNIKVYNLGLSDQEKESLFQYYPGYSVISGFHTDLERDAGIIINGMKSCTTKSDLEIKNLVYERLSEKQSLTCSLTTVSKIIETEKIHSIDLLKIDTEGSELAILNGIHENDWHRIKQLIIEVHNMKDLDLIKNILKNQSFKLIVEHNNQLKESEIYNIFGYRENNND